MQRLRLTAPNLSWFSVVVNLTLPQVYGLSSFHADYSTLFMLVRVYKACVFKYKYSTENIPTAHAQFESIYLAIYRSIYLADYGIWSYRISSPEGTARGHCLDGTGFPGK